MERKKKSEEEIANEFEKVWSIFKAMRDAIPSTGVSNYIVLRAAEMIIADSIAQVGLNNGESLITAMTIASDIVDMETTFRKSYEEAEKR